MVNFLDTQTDARRMAAVLADYDRRLQALERTTQASNSSIEGGAIEIYDKEGQHRGSVGVQPDGAVAIVPKNSPPPPTPTQPAVTPVLGGLLVGWDGLWEDSYTTPSDFSLVQIHVGPAADFTPSAATLTATITDPLGGALTIAVAGYAPVWVRLVAANTAAVTGPVSKGVQGTPRQAVSQDLVDGIVTETKIAQDAVTGAKIALGAVGSTALAAGAVLEDKLGKAAVTLEKIANGAVRTNALGGALSDSASQRYVDAMGDPAAWQVLAQGDGAAWTHLSNIADAPTGRTVGQATGFVRARGTTAIPYEPGTLYRVSARVRLTGPPAAADSIYVGVLGLAADKTTFVNRAGDASGSSHYYAAASNQPITPSDGWVTVVGYLKGRAAPGGSGSAGPNTDPRAAGAVHDNVRFISPYLWLNYTSSGTANAATVMQVDAFTLEALKTGLVDSTNLVVGSVTTGALATDAVTAGKIAADAIGAREIQAAAVTAIELAAGSITADKLTISGGANILSDPSFEGAYTAVVAERFASYASQDKAFGNGSPSSLKIDSTSAVAAWRSVELSLLPISPGDQLYIAVDSFVPATWTGTEINMHVRWEAADSTVLGFGKAAATTPVRDAWTRLSATVTAPAGAWRARVRVEANGTAGAVWWDNAVCRPVLAGVQIADGAVTAPKILAGAITTDKLVALAVTAEKISSLAITTDKLSALSVTADKLAVNSVTASKIEAGAIDAGHIKAGSITADKLSLGTDGNMVADPGFEGPVTDQRLTGQTSWTAVTPGNGSPRAIQVSAAAATATTRTHTLALAPAVPGQRMYLAVDYLASADWVGDRISIYVRWEDNTGASLGNSVVSTGSGAAVKGSWQRLQGVADTAAPPNTVRGRVTISTVSSTAGTVSYDNAVARHVIGADHAGGRAELSPLGLTLYDGDGEESVALVTGRPNYLTFTASGQSVATIDQHGNAGFGNLSVAGKLTVGGDPIDALMSRSARGMVAVAYMMTKVTAGSTDFGFVELAFTADPTRMYRVVLDCYVEASVAGGELALLLRDGGANAPSINSPMIQSAIYPLTTSGWQRVRLEMTSGGFGAGLHRLLTTFFCQWGPSGQNVALFGGTDYPGVFYVEDVGPYVRSTGQYNTGGGTTAPPVQRYTKVYDAAWSGSYANRSGYNSYYGNQMMCGYYSSNNGVQSSLVGFSGQLGADLAGAVIERAEVYLYFDHWYSNAGGTAVIKAHGHGSRPGSFSCDSDSQSVSWARNQGKWVDITAIFDSTSWRGIALDPNSTSSTYYGSAHGVGEAYPPQLRVTYTK
ncbi:hypothetical protein OHS33_38645 (plasmid) [Streptomyces sp. NBC_00536]|uniref:hypothetical protein n=1 Tax=Streptomyces sp. NBC_00536 TaxID=2975769 RepID=UPI002E80733E|nr:hypothetical protein [Streptomyces sp. NBC_00536]WUC84422.1 hypothetical protein OHS33_38645 [Streptomyces sp. NBC_00536]